jgi:glycosyltransferase involved in cell wall biosynthesis
LKVIVIQKGSREHYAVARALHQQGRLAALVTDWYAFRGNAETLKPEKLKSEWGKSKLFRRLGVLALQRFGGASARAARCEGIPDELVQAFPFRSLLWKWRVRRLAAQGRSHEAFLQTDSAFAAAVTRLNLPPHEVFFGYSYASLEMLEAEKRRGVLTVLDQIDPGAVEFRIVAEEMSRHREIAGPPPAFPAAYYERNRREWELANIIVVNSEWSREALIAEGADPAKIEILPLAYEADNGTTGQRDNGTTGQRDNGTTGPKVGGQWSMVSGPPSTLRVLWLGQMNVRKGIHYLMEAAKLLANEPVHFDVVGPLGILPGAVASAPRNMTFHGPVSRDRAAEWYRQADVFVLPTLSDGFALTQLEALAHGLPVIVTPNCGRVVENGKTGFIVPARDARALADAILKFVADRNLSASMSPACREAVRAFSVEAYGKKLMDIIENSDKHQTAV